MSVASIEPELHHRVTEEDCGASECYRGVLTVTGVRYSSEILLFADWTAPISSPVSRASSPWSGRLESG